MKKTLSYSHLVLIHAAIALAIFVVPFLSKIYGLLVPVLGLLFIVRNKNKNNEVLLVVAYLVGVEVFLRMTGGNFNNEYVKFLVIFFMLIGMIYSNFSINASVYLVFLLLLIPGILVTTVSENLNTDIRKALVFNLSGPLCLAIASIYMYKRRILFSNLQNVLIVMGLPIITTITYLFLYNPSVRDVVTGTQSNFETSGGFGPNQVSTILGLGIFIFFSQFALSSKSKKEIVLNSILLIFVSYRAIATFSRGGVITGVVMIICLLFLLYYLSNKRGKNKVGLILLLISVLGMGIWSYTSSQTRGLIEKRYANKDAKGREKNDRLGGREAIIGADLELFLENPILGIGAGMGKDIRKESLGQSVAAHNEISRMLSEHGLFGIFGFLILFIVPFVIYINNQQHLYFFSFFLFWLLTINHAAMRIAAPAFVYALTLLSVQVKIPEKTSNNLK
ncbi:O-Antigen ligase [Flavobacterium sp. CF108]|uniref:O-antigen ligase family protein n=1 Tax=unclassified Flavobacterium TaxID=196869 RepID=UPI0008CC6FF2|nr:MULTISPECIES: O-antigen ligase family protein [unclassified Flavobacterium]SEO48744.1 O-Antigen ligase [Flavobacterium sp. fv08]SHH71713.1 O-Antigen ligase [Flavobacterium sp. CF108]